MKSVEVETNSSAAQYPQLAFKIPAFVLVFRPGIGMLLLAILFINEIKES